MIRLHACKLPIKYVDVFSFNDVYQSMSSVYLREGERERERERERDSISRVRGNQNLIQS